MPPVHTADQLKAVLRSFGASGAEGRPGSLYLLYSGQRGAAINLFHGRIYGYDSESAARIILRNIQTDAQSAGANSHFFDRHGAQVTDAQILTRSQTGVPPDTAPGTPYKKPPPFSSRFTSNVTQLQALRQAQQIFNLDPNVPTINFDFGQPSGLGYSRYSTGIIPPQQFTYVTAIFDANGDIITLYPDVARP